MTKVLDAPAPASIHTDSSTCAGSQQSLLGKRSRENTSDTQSCKANKSPEVLSSTTWAQRLHAAFLEARQARGVQKTPLLVGSTCTGMGTHHMALQDCGSMCFSVFHLEFVANNVYNPYLELALMFHEIGHVTIQEKYMCDPKKAAQKFVMMQPYKLSHYVEDIETLLSSPPHSTYCTLH
eukprot:6093763-Amphidinium_carterae.1